MSAAATATGSMQSLEQSIGARLKITVNYQAEPIEGVLVAVDPQTQTLVLRRLSPHQHLPFGDHAHTCTHIHTHTHTQRTTGRQR